MTSTLPAALSTRRRRSIVTVFAVAATLLVVPTPAQAAPEAPVPLAAAASNGGLVGLQLGDHGSAVKRLQRKLQQTGLYLAGGADGVFGPGTLVPNDRPDWLPSFTDWEEAFTWKPDAIYLLRVQRERQDDQFFPSVQEYHKFFGITAQRFARVRDEGIYIMHPGPVNRGVELVDAVMDYERSLINQQVENGIATRMAVLYWLKPQSTPLPE